MPNDPPLAELWHLLENEYFDDAISLAERVCQNPNAPIEYFCGLSLAYGEKGYYTDAEQVARTAVGFGESHWRARYALAVALMHQGRFLASLDTLGFYRTPLEIYVVRAQVETMGQFFDGLQITLEDALDQSAPPAINLYLAYLYGALSEYIPEWDGRAGYDAVAHYGAYVEVWERDAARHPQTAYGEQLSQHITNIKRLLR